MGLELVELAMDIEDTFGFDIPNADAEVLETVGQTYDYICQRLKVVKGEQCVTMHTFHRLRAATVSEFGVERRTIKPTTPLKQILPTTKRADYRKISQRTGLRMPLLVARHTDWIAGGLLLLAAAGAFRVAWPVAEGFANRLALSIIAALTAAIVVAFLFRKNVWHPRRVWETSTVRQWVENTVALNRLAAPSTEWTDGRVWQVFKDLVVTDLGVKPEQVVRDARYVQDLGAG